MRNDPNKVLRVSADAVVNARDYTMVLADATAAAIALTLITPGVYSEWSIKLKNIGSGDDVTVGVAGGGSFSFTLPAGAGCEVTQDDLGVLHVFGASSSSSGSSLVIPAGQSITYAPDEYDGAGSFQPIGPDLNLATGAGSSDGTDPDYLAPIMGNVIGDELTADANSIAGLIGKLSVTGTRASTYPVAAIIAEVGDGVTEADGAVVAVLGGDSGVTTARAAFTVDNQNSSPGSALDYGLDLRGVDHDGYGLVEYATADIRFRDGTVQSTTAITNSASVDTVPVTADGDGNLEGSFLSIGAALDLRLNVEPDEGATIKVIGLGGQLFIEAANGDGVHIGGEIGIISGASEGNNGGDIQILCGGDTGGGDGGNLTLASGTAAADGGIGGSGGAVDIRCNPSGVSDQSGGSINIVAGTGRTGGGSVVIQAGPRTVSGSHGTLQLYSADNSQGAEISNTAFSITDKLAVVGQVGFYGTSPVARPEVPASPNAQDVVDALLALGLISQAA